MSRNPKPSTRRPATKFPHLQKKLLKGKVRKPTGKKKGMQASDRVGGR